MGHYASEMGVENKYVPSKECLKTEQVRKDKITAICMEGLRLLSSGEKWYKKSAAENTNNNNT